MNIAVVFHPTNHILQMRHFGGIIRTFRNQNGVVFKGSRHKALRSSIYSTDDKEFNLHPRITGMIIKCSNPLMRDTSTCTIFWEEVNRVNKKMEELDYSITHLHTNAFICSSASSSFISKEMDTFCEDNPENDECLIYDI
jgi:hypothetical protein